MFSTNVQEGAWKRTGIYMRRTYKSGDENKSNQFCVLKGTYPNIKHAKILSKGI